MAAGTDKGMTWHPTSEPRNAALHRVSASDASLACNALKVAVIYQLGSRFPPIMSEWSDPAAPLKIVTLQHAVRSEPERV